MGLVLLHCQRAVGFLPSSIPNLRLGLPQAIDLHSLGGVLNRDGWHDVRGCFFPYKGVNKMRLAS